MEPDEETFPCLPLPTECSLLVARHLSVCELIAFADVSRTCRAVAIDTYCKHFKESDAGCSRTKHLNNPTSILRSIRVFGKYLRHIEIVWDHTLTVKYITQLFAHMQKYCTELWAITFHHMTREIAELVPEFRTVDTVCLRLCNFRVQYELVAKFPCIHEMWADSASRFGRIASSQLPAERARPFHPDPVYDVPIQTILLYNQFIQRSSAVHAR